MSKSMVGGGGSVGLSFNEVRSFMQSITQKYQPQAESGSIQRINESCRQLESCRAQQVNASKDTLQQWIRKVEAAKWEAQRPADRSELAHAERMAELENNRYLLAKNVNDLEIAIQREEALLVQERERLEGLRRLSGELDRKAAHISDDKIRALVYHEMGISWASLDDVDVARQILKGENIPVKCRIFSRKSNDVFTFDFIANESSPAISNSLWNSISD